MQTQIIKKQRGGLRKNAGRPKGTVSPQTLEKQIMAQELQQQVFRNTQKLVNTQLAQAYGSIMFFKEQTVMRGNREVIEHILVTDPEKIKEILDTNGANDGQVRDGYFIVRIVPPDTRAIENLLDRGFGRPTQAIEVTTNAQTTEIAYQLAMSLMITGDERIDEVIAAAIPKYKISEAEEFTSKVKGCLSQHELMLSKFRERRGLV